MMGVAFIVFALPLLVWVTCQSQINALQKRVAEIEAAKRGEGEGAGR